MCFNANISMDSEIQHALSKRHDYISQYRLPTDFMEFLSQFVHNQKEGGKKKTPKELVQNIQNITELNLLKMMMKVTMKL